MSNTVKKYRQSEPLDYFGSTILFFLVNAVLIAFTIAIHSVFQPKGIIYGGNWINEIGVWILIIFKIGGANIILWQIIKEFKLKK